MNTLQKGVIATVLVFTAVLTRFTLWCGQRPVENATGEAQKASGQKDSLQFVVEVKPVYLLGEMVILQATLTNVGNDPVKVTQPDIRGGVGRYYIDGKDVFQGFLARSATPLPGTATTLPPGKNLTTSRPLPLEEFPYEMSLGSHRLRAVFSTRELGVPNIWRGEIQTNEITFQVVKPEGKECEMHELFRQLSQLRLSADYPENVGATMDLIHQMMDQFPQSVYLSGAYFQALEQLFACKQYQKILPLCDRYFQLRRGDHPFVADSIAIRWAHAHYLLKEYDKALQILDRYAPGPSWLRPLIEKELRGKVK